MPMPILALRDSPRAAGRVPNTGGAATVSFRGGPLSELGRHNRVGQRIPR